MSSVHSAAQQGFSAEAQRYAQGRPEYPEALSDWLRDALGLRPQTVAVDLGAGTGKFTRLLARTGARVVAVEPVDAMRAQLAEALPQVQALAGSAQSIPLANGFADALVCAQAFHWFATVEALEEMRRVLTAEGGRLGLVWNVRDESLDWVAEITRIITPYEGDAPRFYKGDWRRPFERALRTAATFHLRLRACRPAGAGDRLALPFGELHRRLAGDGKERRGGAIARAGRQPSGAQGEEQVALPYRTEAYLAEAR